MHGQRSTAHLTLTTSPASPNRRRVLWRLQQLPRQQLPRCASQLTLARAGMPRSRCCCLCIVGCLAPIATAVLLASCQAAAHACSPPGHLQAGLTMSPAAAAASGPPAQLLPASGRPNPRSQLKRAAGWAQRCAACSASADPADRLVTAFFLTVHQLLSIKPKAQPRLCCDTCPHPSTAIKFLLSCHIHSTPTDLCYCCPSANAQYTCHRSMPALPNNAA